jgi:hypothetical protein
MPERAEGPNPTALAGQPTRTPVAAKGEHQGWCESIGFSRGEGRDVDSGFLRREAGGGPGMTINR